MQTSTMAFLSIVSCDRFLTWKTYLKKKTTAPPHVSAAAELNKSQQTYAFCQHAASFVTTETRFTLDDQGQLCKIAPSDRALQVAGPKRLLHAVIDFGHLPILAGRTGTRTMYNEL